MDNLEHAYLAYNTSTGNTYVHHKCGRIYLYAHVHVRTDTHILFKMIRILRDKHENEKRLLIRPNVKPSTTNLIQMICGRWTQRNLGFKSSTSTQTSRNMFELQPSIAYMLPIFAQGPHILGQQFFHAQPRKCSTVNVCSVTPHDLLEVLSTNLDCLPILYSDSYQGLRGE